MSLDRWQVMSHLRQAVAKVYADKPAAPPTTRSEQTMSLDHEHIFSAVSQLYSGLKEPKDITDFLLSIAGAEAVKPLYDPMHLSQFIQTTVSNYLNVTGASLPHNQDALAFSLGGRLAYNAKQLIRTIHNHLLSEVASGYLKAFVVVHSPTPTPPVVMGDISTYNIPGVRPVLLLPHASRSGVFFDLANIKVLLMDDARVSVLTIMLDTAGGSGFYPNPQVRAYDTGLRYFWTPFPSNEETQHRSSLIVERMKEINHINQYARRLRPVRQAMEDD